MKEGTLKIHSENILPIIKKWLYTEKEIFVRELVSNACDAITKVKTVGVDDDFKISITIDKEKRQLIFSDNGIGMSADEVEKYIAQLAFSGAEEFVEKYKKQEEGETIIGHFGLGFYSAYMVAETVEIQTLSGEGEAVHWSCDGSSSYTMDKGTRTERGTDVILTLAADEDEYLDESKLRSILSAYCSFLPYPIFLGEERINEKEPLWLKAPSECTDKEYIDFYHHLFPMEPDPLFWIHLNVDYPFHLQGILYFPKLSKERELKSESIKLFCNRVFVSDNCKDLLPDYLTILRGAIDSPDIPLNVSRSNLQMDRTVRQLGTHIAKKVSDRLTALYRTDVEKFHALWEDIEVILKFGILSDEKFYERVKECLLWKNTKEEWTTLEEYLERHPEKKVLYTPDAASPCLNLYEGEEVLISRSTMLDQALVPFLEQKTECTFKRIDAEAVEDESKAKTVLDADGRTEAAKLAEYVKGKLETELEVEAKSLKSDALPAFLLFREEERRMRDQLAMRSPEVRGLVKPTFVVNTNSKLMNALPKLETKNPELAKELLTSIYDMTRLSQAEMEPDALPQFVSRNTQLLEDLVEKLV